MITLFLHDLEQLFGWLLAASWQASVLALLVLGLQGLLRARLNPRWRYALWLLVLARLVLPALPESALSLFQFAPPPPASLVVPVTEPLFVQATLPAPQNAAPPLEPPHPFSAYTLLAVIWLLGAISLLVLTWQVNRRFARQVAHSPEITDPELLESFAIAKKELGIRRAIRLIESSQVQSPAIMGLFRPTLLLPTNVRDKFDARELRFIFLHELAHLKRGDVIVQGLIALLQILHWFNPVLWFVFRRMRIDREPATDALVLSRTGEEEKERYGLMLIKLLEHFNQRHSLPTLVGILEDKDQFKRRFSLIARFTRGAYGWSFLGALLIGALAMVCLTKSKVEQTSDNSAQFLEAVQLDDTATLQKLIDQGVDPKKIIPPSGLLLIEAKSPEAAEILLNHGLDPNARTSDGETPLSVICAMSNRNVAETVRILRVLLKHGADPNSCVGKFNNTPLMLAYAVPVIDLLVESGADPKAVNKDGEDALAVQGPWTLDRVEALIRRGVPFDPEKDGPDILVPACMSGDAPLVKWLLEHGVDPNAPGIWHRDNTEVLKMLPLVAADGNVTLENAKLLLDHGAKADRVAGVALLNEAGPHEAGPSVGQRAVDFIDLLRSRDPHFISELCYQISRNAPLADLQKLLDQGSPADPPEDKVITPLGEASLLGNMDAVKLLLARHADPNSGGIENPEYPNQTHTTPLWLATRSGHKDIVNYLLSHGAKPDSAETKPSGADAPTSPNAAEARQPADEIPDFFASYPMVPIAPEEPFIQITLRDKGRGDICFAVARPFARTGGSSEGNLGGAFATTTDSDYVVDKDVKFIKARYVIHSAQGHPVRMSADLPITSTDAVKSMPIGDGFSATAVLLEPTKLLPPVPVAAKKDQAPLFLYQYELKILTIPASLRDRFEALQKRGKPMDIVKEPGVNSPTQVGPAGLFPDQQPTWIQVAGINLLVQASSVTPDVIYLKGSFESVKYDTFFHLGDHFQVFAVGKTQNAAINGSSSNFFNVLVVRAEETKPGVPMRKLPEY